MEEPVKDEFKELLIMPVEQLKETDETDEFESISQHFTYLKRNSKLHVREELIQTCMLYKLIKYTDMYMCMIGRSNRRVDRLLHILMKISS